MNLNSKIRWLYRVASLVGHIPWPLLKRLSDLIACCCLYLNTRESRVTWRNLELTYPELSRQERSRLHRQIIYSTVRQAFEMLHIWTHPQKENLARLRECHGLDLWDAALARGQGVIMVAPHFGNWELLKQYMSNLRPATLMSLMYRSTNSAMLDGFLQLVRSADNVHQVRADGMAVRQLFKVLKNGGAIGLLADQQPKIGEGVFAPFFGIEALTMTLVQRLAERTGATVLYGWCERMSPNLEFALYVERADPAVADPDPLIAATALNTGIERIARRDPTQYQWTYKRYSLRPPGSNEHNPYKLERPVR
ncbi:lauroyl acyltransferase [Xylella taiwanensis]|uniref:Lauroyl acyltransferase n=1 Tax=Xylella taiwanensis TaxID=1444770 RepID=A0ABS8TY99_9GAMM|nr:lauroyl acyltransferase [Xylella taiwanensis]AXI83144.1 lipid A biosynthesis lauroyl acyltransferase [Xylella taiwanensis]MCD8456194.1 lauroyl acyltransferase [Xylella taiwanensis]MCD8458602.1 lauroyl acyltransferase [Xylella taiwanensis]MCD8460736.1 lauroyl acyltransferase [Xylella taiwanensis]MCD8463204.1 lauroyl acyltransferase [Xylella taiwanensis]